MKNDFSTASSGSRPRNIVISGTNFWNPGDDFVRDGVIRVLRELFPSTPLNFLFYNFNADFFPQDKFTGIANYVSQGDLDQYRDSIDDIVIAGLSAGDEIKDLYRWVIANRLEEKVLLIGAGYENAYVADHVLAEPEATIFRKARLVIGRTAKTPSFVRQTGVPYVHLNCPAILSVPVVKQIPEDRDVQRIGFSIQLPHGEGVVNHSCAREQYELSLNLLRDLSKQYKVEVVAHHKSEYFHFLKLLRGENIPVLFSSFYQDLHEIYPRYDLVITTRLHSSLFANGHGIPGIIINDTDRHTHTLEGFSHSTWVNNRESFQREFKKICESNLANIARASQLFKRNLLAKYVSALETTFNRKPSANADSYAFDSEKKEQALVRSLVKPGMVVFDVGANIGKYTKLFSLLVGDGGKIFAFEPDPKSSGRVSKLVADDALTNVNVLNQAISDECGLVTLNQFPEEYCSWNSLGRPQMEDPKDHSQLVPIVSSVEVEAVTLDAFCQSHQITKIDYLKLDVEGAEFRALQGAQNLLQRQAIRFLQFEVSRKMLEGMDTSARPVFDLLVSHGYECHAIEASGAIAHVVSDSNEFYENYIAIPAETKNLTRGFSSAARRSDKLNVGCGSDYREGFHNIDGNPNLAKVDEVIDIKPGVLPGVLGCGTFNHVLAKDFLEHHHHWEAVQLLRDFHNILANGGTLELLLPNVENIINDPNRNLTEKKLWLYGGQDITQPWEIESPDLNRKHYPQYFCHRYGWTPEELRRELESIGFRDIVCDPGGWNMHVKAIRSAKDVHEDLKAQPPGTVQKTEIEDLVVPLPIHFFTIVLNGQPFIQHHINVLRRLPFQWHWHIVEGVAELNHDTGWSKATGGKIPAALHRNGLSIDGTSEYLDTLKSEFPENVTLYRPPAGKFWDGKRAMVNAPLANIKGDCLLWQIDADELWTESQIIRTRALFQAHPEKTAAFFFCNYFVGRDLVLTSRDTYGNNSSYEWLRVWRHQTGDHWLSHEPPRLGRQSNAALPLDVATLNSFTHAETEAMGLVFQHFAYATEAQVEFKEKYYGYPGAVAQWRQLQNATNFPQRLTDHFGWVKDVAVVNTTQAAGLQRLAPDDWFTGEKKEISTPLESAERILFVRTDSIGDAVLASSMLELIRKKCPQAKLAILCQQHVAEIFVACPFVDSIICFDRKAMEVESERKQIFSEIAAFNPDVVLNSVRSRDHLSNALSQSFPDAQHIAIEGDLNNISKSDYAQSLAGYDLIIPCSDNHKSELEYHADFIRGIGIHSQNLQPVMWIGAEAEQLAETFFLQQGLDPQRTIALFPFTQHRIKNYASFASALTDFADWNFLILGGSETEGDAELARMLPGKVHNLAGQTTLQETAALIRHCRILVGSDSCGAHMACALGVPNVIVLGGGHFGRFLPYSPLTSAVALPLDCYDCNWRCPYTRAHCVKDISANVLAEAIRQTLAEPSSHPRIFIQASHDWKSGANLPSWKRPDQFVNGMVVNIIEVGSTVESNELTPEAQKLVNRAQAALDRGDPAAAVISLEAARKLCPLNADVLIAVGNLHFQLGNLPDCSEALQSATKLRRNDPLVHVLFATVAYRSDRAVEFEEAVTRALELDSSFSPAHRLLADLNLESGQFADAAREYGFVIEKNPNDIDALLALGKCFSESKENDTAESCFKRVLELDPINDLARQNLNVLRNRRKAPPARSSDFVTNDPGMETINCPICDSQADVTLIKKNHDYRCCSECGCVFTPKIDSSILVTENNGSSSRHTDNQDLNRLKRLINALGRFPDTLIDFGCGNGETTRFLQAQGISTIGIDQATSIQLKDVAHASVDGILMVEVIEHLYDPVRLFQQFNQVLKTGGVIYIESSFADGKDLANWGYLDPAIGHCTVHSLRSMERLAKKTGFKLKWLNPNVCCFTKQIAEVQSTESSSPVSSTIEIIGEGISDPIVTVVVSTYRSEQFIRKCLENLTHQTIFSQTEIIVVDSGSEENERAIALEFVQKYPNIRYVRTERETLYAAWNRGLGIARGRYWANLNTDDGLRNDALEIMVAALDQHADCALAYADCVWTTKPNDSFPSEQIIRTVKYPDYTPIETLYYCITGCLQFWRTDSIRQLGGFDASLRCAGDYEATLKMMAAHLNAVHVPEVLSLFYQNTSGLTQASNRAAIEHDQMMNRYRAKLDIRNIFLTENLPDSAANSLAALALYSTKFSVPWEDQSFEHLDFAFACFHKALELAAENTAVGMNLVALNAKINRLDSSEAELIQRWPKMREWINRFRSGEQPPLLQVKPALTGPVFRPSEMLKTDSGSDLALEPEAIRPWISRREGRFIYLSEKLIPGPLGKKYTTKELEALGIHIFKALVKLPPFQAHFGGAGDALLMLAGYYDQEPQQIVLTYPNSIGATRAFFEAFPKMGPVYFLPHSDDPRIHTILRWIMRSLPNCRGAGATPKEGYDEWKAGIDLKKNYGIHEKPRWAAEFQSRKNPRQITLAPQGSLQGMVGSKRNMIDPAVWPDLLRFIQTSGFTPCIIGTPDEEKTYPCLKGCEDRRSYSFREQMEQIANSEMLIAADSWAKTFSALAGVPTIVFDSLKGSDWNGKKDASDFIFLDPWKEITVVKNLEQCRSVFARLTKQNSSQPPRPRRETIVSWQGSFLDHGSLSHVNRHLTDALQTFPDLQIERVTNGAKASPDFKKLAAQISPAPARDSLITVRHAWPPDWSRPKSGKLVVIQPWEFGALPQQWVEQSKQVDEFWVPSNYVREVYVDSGVEAKKVFVVPNGIDPDKFNPQATPMKLATRKKFKFLFVGGTIFRKGPDLLLKAYLESFTATDDVCLVIKDFGGQNVYAGQTFESQINAAQSNPTAPEILYLNEEMSPESLPGLYTACNCFVLPYRGEGFGLPVLEAMACDLPIIVTAGGATDDFVRDEFAYRISAQRMVFGNEISGMKLVKPGWLLEPNVKELAERMRWAFSHSSEARERGHLAGEFARENFSWKKSAEIVAHRIRDLADDVEASVSERISQKDFSKAAKVTKPKKTAQLVLPACAKLGHLSAARELLKKKQFRAAWENTCNAIALRPFHPEAFLLLGEIALASGDSVSARRCAQQARDLVPDWKPARKFLKGNLRGNTKHEWIQLPEQIENSKPANRLTVCLIVKNEEQFIAQCLKSVRDIAQQIVVVDTGSTDRTVEIAKENGAEVFNFAWNNDFSAARNAAMEHVTGDWILVMDADEELLPEHRATILKEMQATPVMAYRLPIIDKGKEQEGCSYVPRLFRNAPGLFFVGRVHEQIFSSIEVRCEEWGLKNQLGKSALLHHGYTKEVVASRDKVARNLKLLQRAIEELPDEPNLLMSLGLELVRSKELEAGLQRYWEALTILAQKPSKEVVPELRETLLTQLSTHLMAAKRFDEIERLWQMPFAKSSMTASQHFLLGLAQMELNHPADAVVQMRNCVEKRHLPTLSPIHPEILKAGPNHCLALSLVSLQQNEKAEKAFRAALKDDPQSRSVRFDFARFQVERGQPLEALQGLHDLIAENPDELRVWQFGGQIALSQNDFLEFARDWTGEAIKNFPDDPLIIAQRGEVLLLSSEAESALPFWRKLHGSPSPRNLAARTMCEFLAGEKLRPFSTADETLISREFLNWYRKLINANVPSIVSALNERMVSLRTILPTFVSLWESAVKEAEKSSD